MPKENHKIVATSAVSMGGGTRVVHVDCLKGFAILLVVFGHVVSGYLNANTYPVGNTCFGLVFDFIYAFHMPLFMMISGYVYGAAYFKEGKPEKKRIQMQVGNLLVVYVLFSVVVGAGKVLLGRFVTNSVSVLDLFLIWALPISEYWYLYVLIAFYLIFKHPLFGKADAKTMLGALFVVSLLSGFVPIKWFQIQRMMYYGFFFFFGFLNMKSGNRITERRSFVLISFAISTALYATTLGNMGQLSHVPVANTLIAIGFSLALWYVFEHCDFLGKSRTLRFFGKYSLEIYLPHTVVAVGFRVLLPRMGISNPYLSVLINFCLSVWIPLGMALFCKRIKIHELIFKPINYISRCRNRNFWKEGAS